MSAAGGGQQHGDRETQVQQQRQAPGEDQDLPEQSSYWPEHKTSVHPSMEQEAASLGPLAKTVA